MKRLILYRKAALELVVIAALTIVTYFIIELSGAEDVINDLFHRENFANVGTLFMAGLVLLLGLLVFSFRRYRFAAFEAERSAENLEMLKSITSSAKDSIILIDNEGKVVLWNKAAETVFGYSFEEIYGKEMHQVLAPKKSLEDYHKAFPKFSRTGQGDVLGRTLELSAIRKNGEEFPIELSVSPVSLKGKWHAIGIVRDITSRKKEEENIRNMSRRLEFILGATNTGFDIIDEDYNIVYIDPEWAKVYGDPAGKKCYEYFMGKDAVCEECGVRKAFETDQRIVTEEVLVREGGRQVQVTTTPYIDENGKRFVAEVNVDISERKKAEQMLINYQQNLEKMVDDKTADLVRRDRIMQNLLEDIHVAKADLQRERDELERSNKDLEQFAYVASHDLQEPLRMIASYVQLLEKRYKNKLDKDADEFIDYAVDGARRMQMLINDLLEYSRVGTRGKPFMPVRADDILEDVLRNLKLVIKNSCANVTYDPLPRIVVDRVQFGQVLQNLIANAIKFRSEDPPKIHISAVLKGKEWLFSVKDNGIGLDSKFSDKIFGIFQRLHTRKEYEGTGIGLAVCKKVIERHGGRLWVESEPEKGSTFFFTIPVRG